MRLLTKSKFIKAYECPTKIYYNSHSEKYKNYDKDDAYLEGLAKGGFQVAALARSYYPDNITILEQDHQEAINKTDFLLRRENVVISEAAFMYKGCFVRTDLLIKTGNKIKLIEIKSKLYKPKDSNGNDQDCFKNRNGTIKADWIKHIADVSFQTYVVESSYPRFEIESNLMLPNRELVATVDGLNQKFLIKKVGKSSHIVKRKGGDLGEKILTIVSVNDLVKIFKKETFIVEKNEYDFESYINLLVDSIEKDEIIYDKLSTACKNCEFRNIKNIDPYPDQKLEDGFKNCWKRLGNLTDEDLTKPSVLDIWDNKRLAKHISENKLLQSNLVDSDLIVIGSKQTKRDNSLSRVERQLLQLNKNNSNDKVLYCESIGLKEEMDKWQYPLHFIDFETTVVALPFHKGMRPFEDIVFQYSHHIVHKNKKVEHKGQWINDKKGHFPNFDFLRSLKSELENDNGTIFKYGSHENSMLNTIYKQLEKSNELDKLELQTFIKTITDSTVSGSENWIGERSMVDMCDLVKKYYYDPYTNGSNSIKDVLPAIINNSEYLLNKYRKKIYGKGKRINSLNYDSIAWVTKDRKTKKCINPYKKLPNIFDSDQENNIDARMSDADGISDGGAAMTAYVMMQFTEISENEFDALKEALLKYCELDTMAMVMIWEHWYNMIYNSK